MSTDNSKQNYNNQNNEKKYWNEIYQIIHQDEFNNTEFLPLVGVKQGSCVWLRVVSVILHDVWPDDQLINWYTSLLQK